MLRFLATLTIVLGLANAAVARAQSHEPGETAAPDAATVAQLFANDSALALRRIDAGVPGWDVADKRGVIGHIGSTWEIAESIGYSGRPLEVLVAIDTEATIVGAKLVRHNEPVLTLGISDQDIADYVSGFAGHDLRSEVQSFDDLPDIISRATVSTGVIRDGILRTARTLAAGRGLIAQEGGIDRLGWQPATWTDLIAMGALGQGRLDMAQAAEIFAAAKVPVPAGKGDFLNLHVGLADPPSVGQNLLGQQEFAAAIGTRPEGETTLIVLSSGLYSHRGTAWRRSGIFDRVSVVQGDTRQNPSDEGYRRVDRLRIEGAPEIKEISLFRLPDGIDPLLPFSVEVAARKPDASGQGDIQAVIRADYALPEAFRLAAPPEPEPLWRAAWRNDTVAIVIVAAMLGSLALIFLAQEAITVRPRLWRGLRLGFLSTTLVVLGWGLGGQLSVVQVVAFLHSLLSGFRWETFLIEPVIFMLWGFVALGLLFWGRGVYCGWLCPFGALQELSNVAAVRLGLRQIAVPQALHERLWILKYTAFVGIVALSFYSMHDALVLAEVEPFKTAISLRMMRAWPFVAFVLALLSAGLFIDRFYCRYLCPLGAGLAIPAKLKIFDWLHRRPQCGRECRLCETKCTVGAIDRVGRINPNECVLCLQCQVIMNDAAACPVLKRRARSAKGPQQ